MSNLKMSLGKGKKDGDPVLSTDEITMPPQYCTVVFFKEGIILYILHPINFHGIDGEILEQQES